MEGPSHFPNKKPDENSEYPNSPESDPQESSENDFLESGSEKSSENDSSEENFVDSSDGEMDPDPGFSAESSAIRKRRSQSLNLQQRIYQGAGNQSIPSCTPVARSLFFRQ